MKKRAISILLAIVMTMSHAAVLYAQEDTAPAAMEEAAEQAEEPAAEKEAEPAQEQKPAQEPVQETPQEPVQEVVPAAGQETDVTEEAEEPAPEAPAAEEAGQTELEEETVETTVTEQTEIVEEETEETTAADLPVLSPAGQSYRPGGSTDPDELFASYFENAMKGGPSSGRKLLKKSAASRLSGMNLALYGKIMEQIPLIASGERASTVIEIPVEELVGQDRWTAQELGVETIFADGAFTEEALAAVDSKLSYDLSLLIDVLLAENPYQMYWYNKTASTGTTMPDYVGGVDENGEQYIECQGNITISFPVVSKYAAGEYTVNTEIGSSVGSTVTAAHEIVDQYAGATDYEKLIGYKNEICSRVNYNHAAVDENQEYGDPWQLIWVFDDDASTDVVCEGYSKAFKYLCDLSSFSGNVSCITVTGNMDGGTGAGGHMWNMVSMPDGQNYLVDVTNCDDGSIGAPDLLFLAGTTDTIEADGLQTGYTLHPDGADIHYTYDRGDATGSSSDMFAVFDAADLMIAGYNYNSAGDEPVVHTHTLTENPGAEPDCWNEGMITYWVCDECGKIFRDAAGEEEITMEDTVLPRTHVLVHEEGLTVDGTAEYWYCENCGSIFLDAEGLYETELAETIMAEDLYVSLPDDLYVGDEKPALVTILPEDATDKSVTFDFIDESIAEAYRGDDGLYYIRALRAGTTDVDVYTNDGSDLLWEGTLTVHGETSAWLNDFYAEYDQYDDAISLYSYQGEGTDILIPDSGILDGIESDRIRVNHGVFPAGIRSLTLEPGVLLPDVCEGAFQYFAELEELHLAGLDVTGRTDMSQMFEGCESLRTLDLTGWDTRDVVKITRMFKGCSSLEELDLSGFDLSSVAGVNEDVLAGMDALRVIRAPLHLKKEIALPAVFSTPDGELVTTLPLNLSESITLTYDHPLDASETTVKEAKWKISGKGSSLTLTFYGNGSLKGINPNKVPWKSKNDKIIKIVFENGVTDMGDLQFYYLRNLQTVQIGSGIQVINPAAFGMCSKLKTVKLSQGLKEIRESAFMDCTGLKTITLPEGIEMIGEYAFSYADNLTAINLPDSLEAIGEGALMGTQIQKAVIPDSITRISDSLFWGCRKLQSVTIPDTVTHIGNSAFGECTALPGIDLPADLQEIGSGAFANCPKIKGYTLPAGTRKIGENAFEGGYTGYLVLPAGLEQFDGQEPGLVYRGNIYYGGSRAQFDQLFEKMASYYGSMEDFEDNFRIFCGISTIIPAESLSVELPDLVDYEATDGPFTAEIGPYYATCRDMTLESSDEDILSLSEEADGWYMSGMEDGWVRVTATVNDGSGVSYSKIIRVSGNEAYARNKFTVVFNANGGTGKMSNQTGIPYKNGKALTANAFKRKGYRFTGWNTRKDGTGLAIANKGVAKELTRTNNGKVTLYAQWELIDYTITYNLNGGTNNENNPAAYTVLDAVTLQKPVRENYVFSGWYTDKKCKTKAGNIKKGTTGNKTYYAKWTPNKYKITFVKNGATGGKMSDMTGIAFNAEKTLTGNAFSRKGYKFVGWNTVQNPTEENPGEAYTNKCKVKGLSMDNGATVKLYAQWQLIDYKITYSLNGGTNSEENPATYQVVTDTITLKSPTRTGYTFSGWYSDKKFKTKVTAIKKGSTGNKTFYAKWTANKYKVAFDKNDPEATGTMKIQTLTYNNSAKLTANAFKKRGYTMTGWNTMPDGTGTAYANAQAKPNVTPNKGETVTLYAQWKLTNYKINYNLPSGAVNNELNPATYTMDDPTFEIQAPSRPGYDFVGWYTDAKLTKAAKLTIEKGSTGNKTFYPKWRAHKYTVVFDKNDPDAKGTMKEQNLTYGSSQTLTKNAFTKAGYTFVGWSTQADGSGDTRKNGAKAANLTTEDNGVVTLFAQWKKK